MRASNHSGARFKGAKRVKEASHEAKALDHKFFLLARASQGEGSRRGSWRPRNGCEALHAHRRSAPRESAKFDAEWARDRRHLGPCWSDLKTAHKRSFSTCMSVGGRPRTAITSLSVPCPVTRNLLHPEICLNTHMRAARKIRRAEPEGASQVSTPKNNLLKQRDCAMLRRVRTSMPSFPKNRCASG